MARNRKNTILLDKINEMQKTFDEMKMMSDNKECESNSDFQSNDLITELINLSKVQSLWLFQKHTILFVNFYNYLMRILLENGFHLIYNFLYNV